MEIIFHGHSFIEIKTDINILIDPFITGNPLCISSPDSFNPDYILLTHGHRDHYGDTEIITGKTGCRIYAMAELSKWISSRGFSCSGFNLGGSFKLGRTRINVVEARHSNSTPDGSYGGLACGFVINYDGNSVYCAGDTSYFGDMKYIGRKFDLDIAFIPIGGTYTMDSEDALTAAEALLPDICIPIHFNTFEAVKADSKVFCSLLVQKGIDCRILEPGSGITI